MLKSKEIQQQYEGFLKTPLLWKNKKQVDIEQFEIEQNLTSKFSTSEKLEPRLGKRVEQFAIFNFEQHSAITIISKNLQIQNGTTTIGELDCLLLKDKKPHHIEIVFKYYLYDASVGNSEIEHWIGPNRRDSLFQKITKLKNKQLPLLKKSTTEKYLESFGLKSTNFEQSVHFKAQLFVPFKDYKKHFPIINNKCIYGFYICFNDLNIFKNCKFYIPLKINWLLEISSFTDWLSFESFSEKIQVFHSEKSAPLCWLKKPNGTFYKFFVVWW